MTSLQAHGYCWWQNSNRRAMDRGVRKRKKQRKTKNTNEY